MIDAKTMKGQEPPLNRGITRSRRGMRGVEVSLFSCEMQRVQLTLMVEKATSPTRIRVQEQVIAVTRRGAAGTPVLARPPKKPENAAKSEAYERYKTDLTLFVSGTVTKPFHRRQLWEKRHAR
jgi:hypothetical protein